MQSETLQVSVEAGPTFHQGTIAKARSALVHFYTANAMMLSVSSTGLSNVAVSPPDMKKLVLNFPVMTKLATVSL